MLDFAVLFVLLGLAVMALQQLLVKLLGLRGRTLRASLCDLVRGVKFPAGFREDKLVDRVLSDKRIDPLGPPGPPAGAVTRVTHVDGATFASVLKDTLGSSSPDTLIDGFAKRPDSVRVEIRQELEGLTDKVVSHVRANFERAMAACVERYTATMRLLSIVLGVVVACAGVWGFGNLGLPGAKDWQAWFLCAIGAFVVPVLAAAWFGLLADRAKFRPVAEQRARSARAPAGSRDSGRPSRGRGGGGGGRSTSGDSSGPDRSSSGGGGGSSRRRGRRSSGRRGGRRGGGGGSGSSGGSGGGGGS
jgi:hypothetical protein